MSELANLTDQAAYAVLIDMSPTGMSSVNQVLICTTELGCLLRVTY